MISDSDNDDDNLSLLSVLQEILILLADMDIGVLDGVQDYHE